jgi:hypothetical protein
LVGDAAGEIVDCLQRHRPADEIGVEVGELGVGVDRRADDLHPPKDQLGFLCPRWSLDPGHGDGGTAGLCQRDRGPFEAFSLAPRLIARRNDLRDGSARNADHRRSHRDGAHAGEHDPHPTN